MTKKLTLPASIVSLAASVFVASGCASMAVSNDAIEQNTAQSLGLAKGSFAISDRVDDGLKANYTVKTNTGKQFACYVTGTVSLVGRVVSDPICSEVTNGGKSVAGAAAVPTPGQCNALLKAAGKC